MEELPMSYKTGDMARVRWPTPLDPSRKLNVRLLGPVPEVRYVGRNGEDYTVGTGWSARVIEPGSNLDQWLIGHVDETCLEPTA
jgi:hypothetical protein